MTLKMKVRVKIAKRGVKSIFLIFGLDVFCDLENEGQGQDCEAWTRNEAGLRVPAKRSCLRAKLGDVLGSISYAAPTTIVKPIFSQNNFFISLDS